MYCNSSREWKMYRHQHRHHGNGWLVALVVIGLIILTHGWILILPLMLLAGLAMMAFFLPRIMRHMQDHNWYSDWSTQWHEKRKRDWGSRSDWGNWDNWIRDGGNEKPKRSDDIEYV